MRRSSLGGVGEPLLGRLIDDLERRAGEQRPGDDGQTTDVRGRKAGEPAVTPRIDVQGFARHLRRGGDGGMGEDGGLGGGHGAGAQDHESVTILDREPVLHRRHARGIEDLGRTERSKGGGPSHPSPAWIEDADGVTAAEHLGDRPHEPFAQR